MVLENRNALWYFSNMSLFCFLWTPLFYLFWRSVSPMEESGAGGVWALLLGSVAALFQFFFGALVGPGGFGFSRWLSGCIDLVVLPALVPLLVYLLMAGLRIISGTLDFTGFALLWIIPMGALRAVSWSPQGDPILLVLIPLLWTGIAGGIPFLGAIAAGSRPPARIFAILGLLVLPFLAATVYWAFFRQEQELGFPLLALTLAPLIASCIHGASVRV
ncbi:MAG: hypothetical protein LBU19_04800 [Treponema sp.]|jgi:hypothetical protein|nr:hypothetical protein [Treponema sp.]